MTARLLLAMVFLCGIVANAHAQQARLYAGGPLFVDKDATSVDCNIHNAGAELQNPTIHIVNPTGDELENFTTCSTTPLPSGQTCTIGVQNALSIAGELITCTVLVSSNVLGGSVLVSGTLEVRNGNVLLYVIPLQPVQ